MILPYAEPSGELTDSKETSSRLPRINLQPESSSFSQSLHDRTINLEQSGKRARSLSPYLPRCLCYNCNVSELIMCSKDLPPVERSNFRTYFARSLSHKFFNCSCYSLANLWQDGADYGVSRSDNCSFFAKNSRKEESSFLCPDRRYLYPEVCRVRLADKWRFDGRIVREADPSGSGGLRLPGKTVSCPSFSEKPDVRFLVDSLRQIDRSTSRIRRRWSFAGLNCYQQRHGSSIDAAVSSTLYHTSSSLHGNDNHDTYPRKSNHRSKCPRAPRLQPQRSFSSPDTRPSIIQPDPTCTARRHRHGISGQMSYFKLLGYNVSKKLTGSANSLFSTAVISGSSSAPNLKDMVPPHASAVAAIEGFGGVPPIRPLETLHNALSLRQLDSFLEMMTSAPLFRTPASSPPKYPSPGGSAHESVNPNLSIGGISREYHSSDLEAVRYITPTPIQYKVSNDTETCDIRNQPSPTSPNSTGWSSEPQSFLSSEPSSPAPTSTGECSMSISLISNDGTQFNAAPKFSTTPCLDLDFNEFCMNIDQENRESRGSVSYTDYYSNEDGQIRKAGLGTGFGNNLQKMMRTEDLPIENIDDDEDHTITLTQTEEQKKQDIKFIFEQTESTNVGKSCGSYKKIGRFRVESMEISDDDVRIKEDTGCPCATSDKAKPSTSQKAECSDSEKTPTNKEVNAAKVQEPKKIHVSNNSCKRKNFSRSQSVSTPKVIVPKSEGNYSYKCGTKLNSFSNMSDKDLEDWKQELTESNAAAATPSEEPILTVASSLTDSASVTIGFNVEEENRE